MSRKKRILIVYEKMGMGHLRMANILADMLGGEDVEIIVRAGSEIVETSDVSTIINMWNFLIRKNLIRTCDFLLNYFTRIVALPIVETKQTTLFFNQLEKIKPDIIVSTADGFNKALGGYAEENNIPFYIFITEISTFIDLICPYATHICYFNETPEAIRNYDFDMEYFSHKLNKATTRRGNLYRIDINGKDGKQLNDESCETIGIENGILKYTNENGCIITMKIR
jgi:hypothetical protein